MCTAADQSRIMQDQMSGAAMGMPQDAAKAFKVKQVVSHIFTLYTSPNH